MQFHYVVFYDDKRDGWSIISDTEYLMSDGSVYDESLAESDGYGWIIPESGTPESTIDAKMFHVLREALDARIET